MLSILVGLSALVGLVSLACWIYTVVVAFSNDSAVIGIVCLCPIVGLVMGFIKMNEWNHQKVMIVWAACIGINIVLQVIAAALGAGAAPI